MEAKELRLGNLVLFNNEIAEIKELFKEEPFYWESIKPIPLTEQWLIDFGFEKEVDPLYNKWKFINDIFFQYIDKEGGFHWYSLKLPYIERIKHVHQLQNLYYSLTGEELTYEKSNNKRKQ